MSAVATESAVQKSSTRWKADLSLALVALIWGTTFVVVKRALTEISAVYFLAIRFGIASCCMLLIFFPTLRRVESIEVWRGLRGGAVAGIFLWLGYMLQTFGLKHTSSGNSGFLTGLYIVLVPLISACVYRKWPQRLELVGIAVATLGMIVLTLPSVDRQFQMNRGDLLTVGCAVAFAFHLLVLGYYSQRERFEAVALGQIVCAAILSTASLQVEPPRGIWTANVVFAIALTSVFATALAFALQTWGQRYTSATRAALIFALEPVFALVTAIAIGGERLSFAILAGGGLILAGILTVELRTSCSS